MDSFSKQEHERLFVSCFVARTQRDRIGALIKSKKGRHKLRRKLAHNIEYEHRYIRTINPNRQSVDGILTLLRSMQAPRDCYVISEWPELDGMRLPLDEALTKIVGSGMGTFVSCIPGKLAFVEMEELGRRFILTYDADRVKE